MVGKLHNITKETKNEDYEEEEEDKYSEDEFAESSIETPQTRKPAQSKVVKPAHLNPLPPVPQTADSSVTALTSHAPQVNPAF